MMPSTSSTLLRLASILVVPSFVESNLFLRQPRIIGGTEATSLRYPYTVALTSGGANFFCGGSLIAPDMVLTAAHCLGGSYSVAVGRHSLSSDDGEEIEVVQEIPHPDYSTSTDENDFALLKLGRSVSVITAEGIVRINGDASYPAAGEVARSMRWGDVAQDDQKTETSDVLMEVDVPVISNEECRAAEGKDGSYSDSYQNYIFDSMICTFEPGQDACQGDSGGPLIIPGEDASTDVLVGVTSWGIGCATKVFPGVFSRISHAYDWISETVCSESEDAPAHLCGTYPPTPEPTASPTSRPTTDSPTLSPSEGPTESPTETPSKNPTLSPTVSSAPSAAPTESPTVSKMPTDSPTTSPTDAPTTSPTFTPTDVPSSTPSLSPSATSSPSYSPTDSPTSSPSISVAPTTSPAPTPEPFSIGGNSLLIPISELVPPNVDVPISSLLADSTKDGTKYLNADEDGDASSGARSGGFAALVLGGLVSTLVML